MYNKRSKTGCCVFESKQLTFYFFIPNVQHTGKHSAVCLSPKQLSTRRLLWKALPLGSRPGPEQMFAQTTQYNILYNIYDVFGTMQKYISLITNRNVHCFPVPRNCCTLFCSCSARKSRGCCWQCWVQSWGQQPITTCWYTLHQLRSTEHLKGALTYNNLWMWTE